MNSCCHKDKPQNLSFFKRFDWILWLSLAFIFIGYSLHLSSISTLPSYVNEYSHHVFELLNTMWWGLALGIFFVGLLSFVPSNYVYSALGNPRSMKGVFRATLAGLLLDLCSHGILIIGMNLYRKGASLGQVMAFLIASPWNSFSLTFILISLIGLGYTLIFILGSAIIAFISGWIFLQLVDKKVLPANPHEEELDKDFLFFENLKKDLKWKNIKINHLKNILLNGLKESRMILRWLLLGIVIASLLRIIMTGDSYATYFGATLLGMTLTLVFSTILEVCSEGSVPIAADIVTRAKAPGNGFLFLMSGVSTDYTEIMSLKDTTKSWKVAFFLPLVTLPQIIILSALINYFAI